MSLFNGEKVDITNFKKSINNMISTSGTSYESENSFSRTAKLTAYSIEEAEEIISSGNSEELRELSLFFFYSSGFYRRFMLYYSTLLRYVPIIIPHMIGNKKKITDSKYSQKYYNCLEFYNRLNFVKLCQSFTLKVMTEGAYYGIFRDYGNNKYGVQDLPFKYCRSRFKTADGVDIVELNLEYFNSIRDKAKRQECLNSFPSDIKKAYNHYTNGKNNSEKWYLLEPGTGIHFCLEEERPFMLNVIPAIIDLGEYKVIDKTKEKQELKKLVIQEMPITTDGELVFEPEEVEEMHRGVVGMLKKNKDTDVLTSFGKVKLAEMQNNSSTIANNLEKIEKTIYSEAGVSKQVFAADGNLSLEKSIQNDIALMMILAESYSIWLSYILTQYCGDNRISFSAKILPVSYYNEEDYITKSLNMAQYGYSILIPAVAQGLNQAEIVDIKSLENDLLSLHDKLIPLQSSHTQSEDGSTTEDGKKVNEKQETKKSDRTLENEQSLDNTGG